MDRQALFRLPAEPKTGLDLLWWTFFELPRLEEWSKGLPRRRVLTLYFWALPWLVCLAIVCYLLSSAVIAATDLPLHFPDQFRPSVVSAFKDTTDWSGRFYWFVADSAIAFLRRLAFGLVWGLALGLAVGLISDLLSGVGVGLGYCAGWLVGFPRLPLHIPQSFVALVRLDLRHNPYRYDAAVRLPLWRARRS